VGGGRRKEDDARARGAPAATQLGVLFAPTILQHEAKNAPPGASEQAPLTNAYRVPWRLPTLTCQPPRVAEIIDEEEEGAEAEIREEHCHLRFREASAIKNPLSPDEDDAFAKGSHPCPSVLGDVLFIPVLLSLASLSRFPLE
jgi:hypothetical protein